jgi:hypothetical protein
VTYKVTKWTLSLVVNWDLIPSFFKNKGMTLNLSSNSYTVIGDKLEELSNYLEDKTYRKKFESLRARTMTLAELQAFMKENNFYKEASIKKIRPITDNWAEQLEEAPETDPFFDDLESFLTTSSHITSLPLFDFTAMPNVEDFVQEDHRIEDENLMEGDWITDEDLAKIASILGEVDDEEVSSIEPQERFNMANMIMENLSDAFESEVEVSEDDVLALFRRYSRVRGKSRDSEVTWSYLLSNIYQAFSHFEDWFLRLMLCYLYSRISRRMTVPKPDKPQIATQRAEHPLIRKSALEEAQRDMVDMFKDSFPELGS